MCVFIYGGLSGSSAVTPFTHTNEFFRHAHHSILVFAKATPHSFFQTQTGQCMTFCLSRHQLANTRQSGNRLSLCRFTQTEKCPFQPSVLFCSNIQLHAKYISCTAFVCGFFFKILFFYCSSCNLYIEKWAKHSHAC